MENKDLTDNRPNRHDWDEINKCLINLWHTLAFTEPVLKTKVLIFERFMKQSYTLITNIFIWSTHAAHNTQGAK